MLEGRGMVAYRRGIYKFVKRFVGTGSIRCQCDSGRPSNKTPEIKCSVDEQMENDDETTESPCM